jgi:hypothetical protein
MAVLSPEVALQTARDRWDGFPLIGPGRDQQPVVHDAEAARRKVELLEWLRQIKRTA